ncbi:MAG TPA: hypothetical protein VK698_16940 [Kofleriaceae bacterium]|nr:hypothetical protein [Kofleriaceae bacterium]
MHSLLSGFRCALSLATIALLLASPACGGSSDADDDGDEVGDGDGDSGGDEGGATSCASICADRIDECGAPPGGEDPCPTLCESLTTAGEASCLESSSCGELAEEFERGEIPCDGAGESEDCDPSDPPRCEGNDVVTCEVIAGMPSVSTETCASDETCEDGVCVSSAECLPLDTRDCNDGECCEGAVCFGEISPSGESYTRCCASLMSEDACEEDADCCGYDPGADYTSRCIGGLCEQSF